MARVEESPLAGFLKSEVPDWTDEVVARARYKGFTGQRGDWESRLHFWRDLVVKCARYLNVVVIDPHMVQHQWFLREGVTPLGIPTVLTEMRKSGELQTEDELLRPPSTLSQYTGSMLKNVFMWVGSQVWAISGSAQSRIALPDHLIVTPLLQERISQMIKILSQAEWRQVCVVTLSRFQELCGDPEIAKLMMSLLITQGKGCQIKLGGKENIEGLKISLKGAPVPDATESDKHMLQLYWTLERLHQQLCSLDLRVASTRNAAILALRSGDKQAALRHARRLKILTISKKKCESFMDRIEEVLTFIVDAETTKKVTDAVKVGAQAMKENHVTLDEVQICLEELDDAISQGRETQDALASAPITTDVDDADFEEEFQSLQAEMDGSSLDEINKLPQPVHSASTQANTSSSKLQSPGGEPALDTKESIPVKEMEDDDEESIEKAFAKLELELA